MIVMLEKALEVYLKEVLVEDFRMRLFHTREI